MSMWEIEELIEHGVILVNGADLSARAKRNFYGNLYGIQEQFDCSYTHFRQTKALMEAGFFHRVDVKDYPGYGEHREYFDDMVAAGGTQWISPPGHEGYGTDFYDPGRRDVPGAGIYFDARSPTSAKLASAGTLTGMAADPIEAWDDAESMGRILQLAADQDDTPLRTEVLKGYYGFGAIALSGIATRANMGHPALVAAREKPELKEALGRTASKMVEERFMPKMEHFDWMADEQLEFITWWMGLYPAP